MSDVNVENNLLSILQEDFGFPNFKSDAQKEVLKQIINSEKDVIVSLATNSGKSACYQIAGKY